MSFSSLSFLFGVASTDRLTHPAGTAAFLASTAKRLNPTDCWCILYPTIKRLLRADVKEITELALLDNAREPVSAHSDRAQFVKPLTLVGSAAPEGHL